MLTTTTVSELPAANKEILSEAGLWHAAPRVDKRQRASRSFAHGVTGLYIVVTAVAPYMYGWLLAPLLGLALVVLLLQRVRVPNLAFAWGLGLSTLGGFGVLWGSLNANPGAFSMMTVFIAEPLLLAPLFGALYSTREGTQRLLRNLDIALLAVAFVGFLVFLSGPLGFRLPSTLVDPAFTTVDLADETLRTNFQGYNSLVFLGAYGVLRALRGDVTVSTLHRGILLLAAISGVILSGRRILYLTTPLVILVAVVAMVGLRKSRERPGHAWVKVMIAGLAAAAGIVWALRAIGLSFTEALARTLGQVTLQDPSGIRRVQSELLLDRWQDSPLIGKGVGAIIPGYARDVESPWQFELTYHVLLLNFGLVGVGILVLWGLGILRRLAIQARGGSIVSQLMMAGFLGTVLASITNPYVLKIDGMWMLFAPFGVSLHSCVTNKIRESSSQ